MFASFVTKNHWQQAWKLSSSKPEPSFSKEGVNVVSTKSQTIENFLASTNLMDRFLHLETSFEIYSLTFPSKLTEFTVRDHLPKCKQLQV